MNRWWPSAIVINLQQDKPPPEDYVYIGRPSKWGNPFSHTHNTLAKWRVKTRDIAISSYERWIRAQPELMAALPELRGKTLGCWCHPMPCHGSVLIKLLQENRP